MPHALRKFTVLKRLEYTTCYLPIMKVGGQYFLGPAVAPSWTEVKHNLDIPAGMSFTQYAAHGT